jgi:hypothetical protein
MILQEPEPEKYMVEGTERLDHDGMEANNRHMSIRLTDRVHYHRVIFDEWVRKRKKMQVMIISIENTIIQKKLVIKLYIFLK